MNDQSINAVYEQGSFRPLEPLHVTVQDGDLVRLRIEAQGERTSLDLAGEVYDGLSPSEIDEVERIALDRKTFFGDRNSN